MGRVFSSLSRSIRWSVLVGVALLGLNCQAADEALPTPPQAESGPSKLTAVPPQTVTPQFKPRYNTVPGMQSRVQYGGGVFEESYFRGLEQPMRSQIEMGGIPQANGWTDYGFPMRPFRWGYFGAEPRRDRMSWHRKYYGEKVKTKYYYGLN